VVTRDVEIKNKLGLHARAAAKFVHTAARFKADIKIRKGDEEVDGKSILGILLLAAGQGTTLTLRCTGPDEQEASGAIVALFADRFGEGE